MKILIIGSGAKEQTIAKLISSYEQTGLVFVAPGNEAIDEFANCIDISADNVEELVEFAKANEIDLTIACSEKAIQNGIAEKFNDAGLMIFSPTSEAAKITTPSCLSIISNFLIHRSKEITLISFSSISFAFNQSSLS